MSENKKFAPMAIAISGISLLVFLGLYFVQKEFSLAVQIAGGLTIIGLALFIYFDPDRARKLFSGRQARYGSNAFLLLVAFIGIVVVINYLIYDNAEKLEWRWDLTEDKANTLAPETIAALEELPGPVFVQGFFTSRSITSQDRAQEVLDDFQFYAKGKLEYEFIDPEQDFQAAQEVGIDRDAILVFTYAGHSEKVTSFTESEFTNAIVRLLNPGDTSIYFLTGHGERNIDGADDQAISQVKSALENKNYVVATLNLLTEGTVPADAIALVIAGPQQEPISEGEMALIAGFVAGGGALIVAEDPSVTTEIGNTPDPIVQYLIETWGIELGNDLVIDATAVEFFNSPFIAIAAGYGDHPVVNDLTAQQLVTVFPLARSVRVTSENADLIQTPLITTSDQSWAETDMESLNTQPEPDPETDLMGPVMLAVAAENILTGARIVVIGDSDFFIDVNFGQYGNGDLIANAVDWAAANENLIELTPKSQTQRLILPPQGYVINLIALGSLFGLPGLVLIAGVVVWIRRRRRA